MKRKTKKNAGLDNDGKDCGGKGEQRPTPKKTRSVAINVNYRYAVKHDYKVDVTKEHNISFSGPTNKIFCNFSLVASRSQGDHNAEIQIWTAAEDNCGDVTLDEITYVGIYIIPSPYFLHESTDGDDNARGSFDSAVTQNTGNVEITSVSNRSTLNMVDTTYHTSRNGVPKTIKPCITPIIALQVLPVTLYSIQPELGARADPAVLKGGGWPTKIRSGMESEKGTSPTPKFRFLIGLQSLYFATFQKIISYFLNKKCDEFFSKGGTVSPPPPRSLTLAPLAPPGSAYDWEAALTSLMEAYLLLRGSGSIMCCDSPLIERLTKHAYLQPHCSQLNTCQHKITPPDAVLDSPLCRRVCSGPCSGRRAANAAPRGKRAHTGGGLSSVGCKRQHCSSLEA